MPLDPELYKQLIESFSNELAEHIQAITNGLLKLEKNNLSNDEYNQIIELIFRSAHNIKGTSFSLGINTVGEIAHTIESLFSDIRKKARSIHPELIDDCLDSIDKMKKAFSEFIDKNSKKESDHFQTDSNVVNQKNLSQNSHEYDSIRVPIHQIEKISSLLEEMQKYRHTCSNDLSILITSLQAEVGQLRMIPVGNLLCTFPRYVRDLSRDLNKNVELIIKGEDVKIDKAVLEGLKDPIIHLLRNAIDHGIELEDIRKKMGKPEKGHITIEIKEEHALIKMSITDDGAGIDITQLSDIAERKKIVSRNELDKMDHDNKLELIFRSGFSTKDIITDVSGRGVGLDVVKSNIENLKGTITLSTVPGKQTTFTLSVPLSVATDRGLLIKSGGYQFVVPTFSVEQVMLIHFEQIVHVQGGQAIIVNNKTIPFRLLSATLGLENNRAQHSMNNNKLSVIIIKRNSNIVAFLVDEIIGEKEILIKSFHEPLTKIPCVSGGTLLDNNQVVMVLDPGDLITYSLDPTQMNRVELESDKKNELDKKRILVVDDSITTRTLEKNVLESRNYQVTIAVNGKEAWDILQKQTFSLLITDVMMPVMDGFTLTEHVKTSEHLRNLPVIIVTSLGSDAEKQRGIEVGADAYIVKNEFESGELLSIVSQLV